MDKGRFKEGCCYYAEMKAHDRPDPILNVFKVISVLNNGLWTLICIHLVSNWNAGWNVIPVEEIIRAHKIRLEDLPLYINWKYQTPAFHELLKKGLPNET